MSDLTITELEKRNAALLQLIIRLSTIIFRNIAEQRELASLRADAVAHRLLATLTPAESVDRLREVSMRCSALSQEYRGREAAQTLEALGVQLATEAQNLERMLRISRERD